MKATKQRWVNLCAALEIAPNEHEFSRLAAAYSETHRAYHTLQHISECLSQLDRVIAHGAVEHYALAEMALWYHDAIYQPNAGDNEQKSAEWAHRFLLESGVGSANCKFVYSMIMCTRHEEESVELTHQLVADIDLAILGSERARFEEYERQIRQEYQWIPMMIYNKERRRLLQKFLDRPRVYKTELFYTEYEHKARENLNRSIENLRLESNCAIEVVNHS